MVTPSSGKGQPGVTRVAGRAAIVRAEPHQPRTHFKGESMPINPDAIGATTDPQPFEWTDRDTLLYALGVGAGTKDLAFTTENSHDIAQQVLPTYAVIACPAWGAAAKVGSFNWAMLLHGPADPAVMRRCPVGQAQRLLRGRRHPGQGRGQERHPGAEGHGHRPGYGRGDRRDGVDRGDPRRGRLRRSARRAGRSPGRSPTASPTRRWRCRPPRTSR